VYDDEWPGASVLLLQELGASGLGATPVSALLRGSAAWLECTPTWVHSGRARRRTGHDMSEEVSYNTTTAHLQLSTARLLVRGDDVRGVLRRAQGPPHRALRPPVRVRGVCGAADQHENPDVPRVPRAHPTDREGVLLLAGWQ
jgi:hypothetical protein